MSLPKQILIYGVGGAASRLAAVLLVPLYTRTLSIDDYGNLEVLLALNALALLLGGMQSESAVARDYFDAKSTGSVPRLLWGSLLISVAGTVLVIAISMVVAALGLLPPEIVRHFPLMLAITLPAQLLGIQQVAIRFNNTPVRFAALSFLDLTLSAVFSAWLILQLKLGITGALVGILSAKLVCCALAWPATFGLPTNAFPERPLLKSMLSYSVPTLPSVLLNWAQSTGSRALLALFVPFSQVGLAGIAMKVAALYAFLIYSFRLAWEPYAFQRLSDADSPDIFRRVLQWYVATMLLIAGGIVLLAPVIVAILAPAIYASAAPLVVFFVLGQFWIGAVSVLSIGIHGARVTSKLTQVYAAGAMLNLAILAIGTPIIGIVAAGVGSLLGSILSALIAAYYSNRFFALRFNPRLLAITAVGTLAFGGVASLLQAFAQASGATFDHQVMAYSGTSAALAIMVLVLCRFGFDDYSLKNMWVDFTRVTLRRKATR